MKDIEVKVGEIQVSKESGALLTYGIGSCVVIILYEPKLKIGGLAHTMLPSHSNSNPPKKKDARYIDIAIDEMLKRMYACGAKRKYIEAKLVGGGNMFPTLESNIGMDNVMDAKVKLEEEGIKLVGETVGGSRGRSVEFCIATGIVTVKIKF